MDGRLSTQVQIRVNPKQLALWRAFAASQGMTLSQLLRKATDVFALEGGRGEEEDGEHPRPDGGLA